MTLAIIDTTFSRADMGKIAADELKKLYPNIQYECSTVPGIKDLAVECKKFLDKNYIEVAIALGYVGSAEIDKQCAHEASLGIQAAKLLTGKHIIEVFVHENEAYSEKELFSIINNRVRKHVSNALKIIEGKNALSKNAGKGIRQGKDDEGSLSLEEQKPKLAFVVSMFHRDIALNMIEIAKAEAEKQGIEVAKIAEVHGAYDSPLIVQKLLEDKKINGVAVLGYVEKGTTAHDKIVAYNSTKAFVDLSLKYKKPVVSGLISIATKEQALERVELYSKGAVNAFVKLYGELKN